MNINSTESLRNVIHSLEDMAKNEVARAEYTVEHTAEHIGHLIGKDTSRAIHSLTVNTIAAGKDITIVLDHAAGQVLRIVVNGTLTVESLVKHVLNLAAPHPAATPEPTEAPALSPEPVVITETPQA